MIWVKIDESQIGFYLKFITLLTSTKGMIINFLLNIAPKNQKVDLWL